MSTVIYPSLSRLCLQSHSYWRGGRSFTVSHFLNFYFQVIVFTYFIKFIDCYYQLTETFQFEGIFLIFPNPIAKSHFRKVLRNRRSLCHLVGFSFPMDHIMKVQESEKNTQIFWPCYLAVKAVLHEKYGDTNLIWCYWNGPQRFGKENGIFRKQRRLETEHCSDHWKYSVKSWKTEERCCHSDPAKNSSN